MSKKIKDESIDIEYKLSFPTGRVKEVFILNKGENIWNKITLSRDDAEYVALALRKILEAPTGGNKDG